MTPTMEQYVKGPFTPHHLRLSDDVYGAVLDSCVLACVDVLVYRDGQMLLGKRQQKPAAGMDWILGGRMLPGERFEHTAQRIMRREASIEIQHFARFRYMGVKNYLWPDREQLPQSNGCHMIGFYMAIEITQAEAGFLSHRADFTSFRWVEIKQVADDQIQFHPALCSLADQLLK